MRAVRPQCTYAGCDATSRSLGYCSFHYWRQHRGIPMDAPRRKHARRPLRDDESAWVHVGDFVAPEEHALAVQDEADRRGVRKSVVLREALAEWVARRAAPECGAAAPEGMTPEAARARIEGVVVAALREGVSPDALRERFSESGVDVASIARRHGIRLNRW